MKAIFVHPAWVTAWRWKSIMGLVVATISQKNGCPWWGGKCYGFLYTCI